jgi:hypothetical protein
LPKVGVIIIMCTCFSLFLECSKPPTNNLHGNYAYIPPFVFGALMGACFTLAKSFELSNVSSSPRFVFYLAKRSSSSTPSVCNFAKKFRTSKFSYLLFSNPTHKTKSKAGSAYMWETTNSNPPGPIIMNLANQNQGAAL